MSRPAHVIIDLAAIGSNLEQVKKLAPNANIMAVVKANAYGHNALQVAKALSSQVRMFTVSCLEEALALRKGGINQPILLLEGCFQAEELQLAAQQNFEIVLHSQEQIKQLLETPLTSSLKLWLKFDTGMHRLGLPCDQAASFYQQLQKSDKTNGIKLMSHFAHADDLEGDFTLKQLTAFEGVEQEINQLSQADCQVSLANSAAILAWPTTHRDWVRPGIMLYGLSPFTQDLAMTEQLVPAMNFESEVIALRKVKAGQSVGYGCTWQAKSDALIATVAVGYGDGYPRNAKSGTPVWINGQLVPLVGRVSMDLISIEVTQLTKVKIGDRVVLWGKELSADRVAKFADTIGYELVTRMPSRAARHFINQPKPQLS
ncbi:alanine racemase [Paraglaciecola aestuariivivens]